MELTFPSLSLRRFFGKDPKEDPLAILLHREIPFLELYGSRPRSDGTLSFVLVQYHHKDYCVAPLAVVYQDRLSVRYDPAIIPALHQAQIDVGLDRVRTYMGFR